MLRELDYELESIVSFIIFYLKNSYGNTVLSNSDEHSKVKRPFKSSTPNLEFIAKQKSTTTKDFEQKKQFGENFECIREGWKR